MDKDQSKLGDEVDTRINKQGIVCHCFSPDLTKIAVSNAENHTVEIYEIGDLAAPNRWKQIYVLKEHSQTVALLDWSINYQLLTGSYDRNVVVWNLDQKLSKWKPELVMMENNRAILTGGWGKNGKKFALGAASHKTFIGYFAKENNWWFCEKIKKFKSSVVAVELHPSGRVVATGSTDFSFKLISCYITSVDDGDNYKGIYEDVKGFGDILFEYSGQGWVEALAWSPSGKQIAFAAHDLTVSLVKLKRDEAGETDHEITVSEWEKLPFLALIFKNENEIIAGGYDYNPVVFKEKSGKWEHQSTILTNEFSKSSTVKSESKVRALAKSFNPATNPTKGPGAQDAVHLHKTPIICLKKFKVKNESVEAFSTNDIQGSLFIW